jgi:GNAT superfamily N-acetyltransferase
MDIRAMMPQDLGRLMDIDGTVHSSHYLHLDRSGEGLAITWKLEERPLREKRIDRNAIGDDTQFLMKQLVIGAEEGVALAVEHEGNVLGALAAVVDPNRSTLRLADLRVDFDYRREGLGSALLYRAIQEARDRELRAVMAQTKTNNASAAHFLKKAGFDLAGMDERMDSNHDLVKEAVTLFWYAALD